MENKRRKSVFIFSDLKHIYLLFNFIFQTKFAFSTTPQQFQMPSKVAGKPRTLWSGPLLSQVPACPRPSFDIVVCFPMLQSASLCLFCNHQFVLQPSTPSSLMAVSLLSVSMSLFLLG